MTSDSRWLPPFVHPLPEFDGQPARPVRAAWTRWAAALGTVALVGPPGLLRDAWGPTWHLPGGVEIEPLLVAWALTAAGLCVVVLPHVGYRQRDWALVLFVPLWGLVVAWRLGWRAVALPYRDWPPRDDELPRVRVVPGADMYVLAPPGTTADVPAETSP